MNNDLNILLRDLRTLGVEEGYSMIINSSYKSMVGLSGGIESFVDAGRKTIFAILS